MARLDGWLDGPNIVAQVWRAGRGNTGEYRTFAHNHSCSLRMRYFKPISAAIGVF